MGISIGTRKNTHSKHSLFNDKIPIKIIIIIARNINVQKKKTTKKMGYKLFWIVFARFLTFIKINS